MIGSAPDPLPIPSRERIDPLSILSLWLVYTGHMTNGSGYPLGSGSGVDQKQIGSISRADPLSIQSLWSAQIDHMGIRSRSAP